MSIREQLENVFGHDILEATDQEFRANCPKCVDDVGRPDSKHHLYINPYKKRKSKVSGLFEIGAFNCFRCGWKGWGLDKLGADLSKEVITAHPLSKLRERIDDNTSREEDNILLELNQITRKDVDLPKEISYPRGYTTDWSLNVTGRAAYKYLINRGVTNDQIKKNKMGYCWNGPYGGFLILPVFQENVLVYYVARSIYGKIYKNAPVSSKDILFNFDKSLKTICLVEGIFDALSIGKFGVAMLGKTMKEAQAQKIIKAAPETVYICLDSDAKQSARNIVNRLKDYIENVILVDLGKGKDPNSVSKAELFKAFKTATKIDTNIDVLKWMLDNA